MSKPAIKSLLFAAIAATSLWPAHAQSSAAGKAAPTTATQSAAETPASKDVLANPAYAYHVPQNSACLQALIVRGKAEQPDPQPQDVKAALAAYKGCLEDYGYLQAFSASDKEIAAIKPEKNRVVFLGDSITQGWDLASAFPGKPYINRGISAQTTPQMLARFRQDVVDLKPAAVLILAGTNDLSSNTGPETVKMIEDNYRSMAEIAAANRIKVIMASVTPIHDYAGNNSKSRPPEKIRELNDWMQQFCGTGAHARCVYLDYFSHMVDDKGMMQRDIANDGLHPNAKGYAIMAPLAEKAIEKVVGK